MPVTAADIEGALGACDSVERCGSPGGSGECWRVEREGEVLAFKVIVKNSEPERFEREVTALERIDSERVVAVKRHGDLAAADGNTYPYLVSTFLEGGDVRDNLVCRMTRSCGHSWRCSSKESRSYTRRESSTAT